MISAAAASVLLSGIAAHAQTLLPPNESAVLGRPVADAVFVDDAGKEIGVSTLAGRPIVVSPIFTRCRHTCSTITKSLAHALAALGEPAVDFEVLSLSFDAGDTPDDLARYRQRMKLPPGWRLARADSEQLLPFLDSFDFRFISESDGGFTHPNLVVVLEPDLTISRFIYGTAYESEVLGDAIEAARRGGSGLRAFGPLLFTGAVAGALLAALAMGMILHRMRRRADEGQPGENTIRCSN
jgi:protein SCO1/2